jgi:hypothetical protein
MRTGTLLLVAGILLGAVPAWAADFIRPEKAGDPLLYGIKNGIVIALHPAALDGRRQGGPRGLLRVGYQDDGKYHLINYIAVEPVVGSEQGFSELEKGGDGQPGKRFWVGDGPNDGGVDKTGRVAGRVEDTSAGRELSFVIHVEPFANGARPVIEVSFSEKWPERVRFRTYGGSGGKAMRRCVLTATMGNQSRCRCLWLKSGAVLAPGLYSGYTGNDFVEKAPYGLAELWQTKAGDMVAAISPDEFEPREVWPLPTRGWHHDGSWMAQFWLKPRGTFDRSLRCRVNGRRVYWAGEVPIPGGIAYENFELREDFHPGQEVWFGYTPQSPAREFGFEYDAAPGASPRRTISKAEEEVAVEAARTNRPLTNGDFTNGLDGWHTEGGGNSFRTWTEGKETTLTTMAKNGERDTGRLYQCFRVPADANELRFSLAGGADTSKLRVALWQGDRLYRRMTARNDRAPFRVRWDVVRLRGEVVTLEVVDESTAAWGFLSVAGFALAGKK